MVGYLRGREALAERGGNRARNPGEFAADGGELVINGHVLYAYQLCHGPVMIR